jgi:hypothetical protein
VHLSTGKDYGTFDKASVAPWCAFQKRTAFESH